VNGFGKASTQTVNTEVWCNVELIKTG